VIGFGKLYGFGTAILPASRQFLGLAIQVVAHRGSVWSVQGRLRGRYATNITRRTLPKREGNMRSNVPRGRASGKICANRPDKQLLLKNVKTDQQYLALQGPSTYVIRAPGRYRLCRVRYAQKLVTALIRRRFEVA